MASVLADWKSGTRKKILWVDYERYAYRVFSGSPDDWYRNPTRFAAAISQAHRIISTDIVTVDVTAPFIDFYQNNAGKFSGSAVSVLQALFSEAEPAEFVSEVIDALAHSMGTKVDFAFKIQSPRDLLLTVGASAEEAADFGNLDDTGIALVAMIRQFSSKPFSCLQIATGSETDLSADEQDAGEPLLRAAEYYGWASCFSFEKFSAKELPAIAADFILLPEWSAEAIAQAGNERYGGGLPAGMWCEEGELPQGALRILHGRIPEDASPELVAEKMKSLASFG